MVKFGKKEKTISTKSFATVKVIAEFGIDLKVVDATTGEVRKAETIEVSLETGSGMATKGIQTGDAAADPLAKGSAAASPVWMPFVAIPDPVSRLTSIVSAFLTSPVVASTTFKSIPNSAITLTVAKDLVEIVFSFLPNFTIYLRSLLVHPPTWQTTSNRRQPDLR